MSVFSIIALCFLGYLAIAIPTLIWVCRQFSGEELDDGY